MKKEKIALSFSGGKDAMMALYYLKQSAHYEVSCLLTTVSKAYQRVVMQGVRESLVEAQAKVLGLPLIKMSLNESTMACYELNMTDTLRRLKRKGIAKIAYGDIFLSALKDYREAQLEKEGMSGVYPLWQMDTDDLKQTFWETGHRAVVTAVCAGELGEGDVGKPFDSNFVSALPESVDSVGENGEFHTFVTHSPLFESPISVALGRSLLRQAPNAEHGTWYVDLLLSL